MTKVVDYALWPLLVLGTAVVAWLLLDFTPLPPMVVTPLVVGPFTALVLLLEKVRPEWRALPRDQPLLFEALHFVLSFELGYGLSLLASEAVGRGVRAAFAVPSWPGHWPLAVQVLAGIVVYESTSYWQHRWLHRYRRLFRFHALHHSGARLEWSRAVRFHMVDIGTAGFVAYVPLVIFATPDRVFTMMGVVLSVIGLLQHGNVRVRTPRWLDWLVCTPAVHRLHHSAVREESDRNFANSVMVFDHVFGTYGAPKRPEGPERMGLAHDPVPRTFFAQIVSPFRR